MEDYYTRNSLDDERRRLILQRLEQERQLRRQHVRDGTIDQFKLQDITDVNNCSENYSQHYNLDNSRMSGMRDPSEIMMIDDEEDANEDLYGQEQDADYYVAFQRFPQNVPQMHPHPNQMMKIPDCQFGYNPENLYDPNTMQNVFYPEMGQENSRDIENINPHKRVR